MARISTLWRLLPAQELGCGSAATVWRRLSEWAKAGVFDALHLMVLDQLGSVVRLDWSRASVDTVSVRAKHGGTMFQSLLDDVPPVLTPSGRRCGRCRG